MRDLPPVASRGLVREQGRVCAVCNVMIGEKDAILVAEFDCAVCSRCAKFFDEVDRAKLFVAFLRDRRPLSIPEPWERLHVVDPARIEKQGSPLRDVDDLDAQLAAATSRKKK